MGFSLPLPRLLSLRPMRLGIFLACPLLALGQNRIGTGKTAELYKMHCLTCHGDEMQGGLGANLVDGEWNHGNSDAELADIIRNGVPEMGMSGFESILSDQEIRSMVIYMREVAQLQRKERVEKTLLPQDGVYSTEHHRFRLEEVASLEGVLWSIEFMPDASILVAERGGTLYHLQAGRVVEIQGIPEVRAKGQGGLMEVALHPDYRENGWIYLGFTHRGSFGGEDDLGMPRIVRGKLEDGRWTSEESIYTAPPESYTGRGHHFGTRIVFQDGYLFFPIGDRGRQNEAQDLSLPNGKVHRIHDDGRIPADNPFFGEENALPTIWSYGHRNPQGLDLHPLTGDLWSTEHGPRGGDETNRIERGLNYGWPLITHGMNYNGTPITAFTAQPGMEQPEHFWTPSIAVCGIDFYAGTPFAKWQNDLLVAGLASQELRRLVIEDRAVVKDEIILKNAGRVRDVATGPDGLIYVTLMNNDRSSGRLCRLVPVE